MSELELSHVVVAGGAGFIGSAFARNYLAWHPQARVTVLDTLTYAGNPATLIRCATSPRFAFVQADIGDYDAVARALEDADAAVSFAAETHVDRSILDPDVFVQTNLLGLNTLLRAPATPACGASCKSRRTRCTATWGRGPPRRRPPQAPQSVRRQQGRGDLLAFSYHTNFGLPVLVTRGANTIGPYQYPEKATPSSSPTPWTTSPSRSTATARPAGTTSTWTTTLRRRPRPAAGDAGEAYNVGTPDEVDTVQRPRASSTSWASPTA